MKYNLKKILPTDRNNPADAIVIGWTVSTRARLRKCTLILLLIQPLIACKNFDDRPRSPFFFDFETNTELDRFVWRCGENFERSQEFVTHGQYGLRLEIFFGKDPGLKPMLYETDWSRFRTLQFDVSNPQGDTLIFTIKIAKDRYAEYSERVDKQIRIPPGRQHFAIPLDSLVLNSGDGVLDLSEIGLCKIFLQNPWKKCVLFFDYLHLE